MENKNNRIELYIYNKVNTELYFDVYEGSYGGENNSSIYYGLKDENYYGFKNRMNSCDIGKVLYDNTIILIGRDDKKASDIFATYYSKQIEKLQDEITKLQTKQKTNKVSWFRNGVGCFEEKEVDF